MKMRKVKIIGVFCLLLMAITCVSSEDIWCAESVERIEGEVVGVNIEESRLQLCQTDGQILYLTVTMESQLYYNNQPAVLGMLSPVTEKDFVSGFVKTDQMGKIIEAHFYYRVREGVLGQIEQDSITLDSTVNDLADQYQLAVGVKVVYNSAPGQLEDLKPGMRALLILDHRHEVKKIAVFHYDYMGFIQQLNLDQKTMLVNIGTRLEPIYEEFCLDDQVLEATSDWEQVTQSLQKNALVMGKFLVAGGEKRVTYLEMRVLA